MPDLLPAGVSVRDLVGEPGGGPLLPEERAALGPVSEQRRREFAAARRCAREAVRALGLVPGPLPPGPDRAPVWPGGLVGSLTHCRGYTAAAVAPRSGFRTVGIDAEPCRPLPRGVLAKVADARERAHLASLPPGVPWDTVLFSAKESVYKAWHPLARTWLGFADAALVIDPAAGAFTATIGVGGPVTGFTGRFAVRGGLVLTAIALEEPCA